MNGSMLISEGSGKSLIGVSEFSEEGVVIKQGYPICLVSSVLSHFPFCFSAVM
jgi:hypothetical protein